MEYSGNCMFWRFKVVAEITVTDQCKYAGAIWPVTGQGFQDTK